MASVPKPTAIAPAAPASAARSVGPAVRVASVSTSVVDAPDIGANISFDATASGYQEEQLRQQNGDTNGREQRRYPEPGANRLFTADSQAFARMFEIDAGSGGRNDGEDAPVRITGPRSKIISTYETNALVVSGQQPIRGTSMSFSL